MPIHALAAWLAAGLAVTAQEPTAGAHNREKEAALGKQLAADFRRHTTPIENPAVLDYLDALGRRLAAQTPEVRFPFTFSAVSDDPCPATHEPAVFPGGYVFVPSELFLAAQEEAEFAAMVAHAIAHIALRHGVRQLRESPTNNSGIPLIFLGGWGGSCSEGRAVPLAFLKIQRGNELEADLLAIQIAARVGFDPEALMRYIQRVQPAAPGTPSKAYSALPDRNERAGSMVSVLKDLPRASYAIQSTRFAAIQQEVRQDARRLIERPEPSQAPPSLRRKPPT